MTSPAFNLNGKVALITGASRGIGFSIAETYAAAGAQVVLASRKQEDLDEAAERIRGAGGEALPIAAHTGDPQAVKNLISETLNAFEGIDILVNNAGTNPHFGPILSAQESHWDKILDVNLRGYFRLAKACVGSMRARGGGKIINVSSVNGLQAQAGLGVYCVSKAGVLMLTQVLALELASENIQVNAIAPGLIKTKFSQLLWDTPPIYKHIIKNIPQRRIAEPEELAGIALYLASEASNFTTGATFVIDGGQLAGSPISPIL